MSEAETTVAMRSCRWCDLKGRDACGASSAMGLLCTRHAGHYGFHTYCAVDSELSNLHPTLSWDRPRAESDVLVNCLQRILAEEEPDSWVAEQICEALGAE